MPTANIKATTMVKPSFLATVWTAARRSQTKFSIAGFSLPIFISERIPYVHLYRAAGACVKLQFRDYLPLRTGPNAGGEMRRFEAASYAEATRRIRSSAPGSAPDT